MKFPRLMAAALAMAVLTSAAARSATSDLEYYTGDDLYLQCKAAPADADFQTRQARCLAYVIGVSDAEQAAQGAAAGPPATVCLSASVTSPQLIDAVVKFMDGHPEKRRLAAQDLVLEALRGAFPCK
ncbi:MAG: Rap1a/Tai family immunity protein [Caulobacterales bacterium]